MSRPTSRGSQTYSDELARLVGTGRRDWVAAECRVLEVLADHEYCQLVAYAAEDAVMK